MPGWISGALLFLAGVITSFFVAPDALNFSIIRMVVAILLFILIALIIAFWAPIKKWVIRKIKKNS